MTSNVVNRKTYRAGIAAELAVVLVGSGLPAQVVKAGNVGDFNGQSPAVIVSSGGSGRIGADELPRGAQNSTLFLNVSVLVEYTDPESGYTDLNSEDTLDDIEKKISDWIIDNATRDPGHASGIAWTHLTTSQRTETGQLLPVVAIGGRSFRTEEIPLSVHVMGQV